MCVLPDKATNIDDDVKECIKTELDRTRQAILESVTVAEKELQLYITWIKEKEHPKTK